MYDGGEGWWLKRFVRWWWNVSPVNVFGKIGRCFKGYVVRCARSGSGAGWDWWKCWPSSRVSSVVFVLKFLVVRSKMLIYNTLICWVLLGIFSPLKVVDIPVPGCGQKCSVFEDLVKELGFLVKMKVCRVIGRWCWDGAKFSVLSFQIFPVGSVDMIEGYLGFKRILLMWVDLPTFVDLMIGSRVFPKVELLSFRVKADEAKRWWCVWKVWRGFVWIFGSFLFIFGRRGGD